MLGGLLFAATMAAVVIVALRKKQSPIVAIGGGFLAGCVALALFGPRDRPRHPTAADVANVEQAIRASQDYTLHSEVFQDAAARLVAGGTCSVADFERWGGWSRSSIRGNGSTYFAFCGGSTVKNRIYLDAQTGQVWR